MLSYDVGSKVVCRDAKFPIGIEKFYDQLPAKDQTYVVRDIRLGADFQGRGEISVLLVGVVNPCAESKSAHERGFRSDRFVPLQELKDRAQKSTVESTPAKLPELVPA